MVIGLIGEGFVGSAVSRVALHHEITVWGHDLKHGEGKISLNGNVILDVFSPYQRLAKDAELIFICLPTPQAADGSCDTSIIDATLASLNGVVGDQNNIKIVIKSTVVPGSVDAWSKRYPKLDICFNPEFLSERTAFRDFRSQRDIILGGNPDAMEAAKKFYAITHHWANILETSALVAELVKYTRNCFWTVNISFANELKQICDKLNADYNEVISLATTDPNMDTKHWAVPGPSLENGQIKLGFGGHCFPKDLSALITKAKELGVTPTMMQAAWDKNQEVRNG